MRSSSSFYCFARSGLPSLWVILAFVCPVPGSQEELNTHWWNQIKVDFPQPYSRYHFLPFSVAHALIIAKLLFIWLLLSLVFNSTVPASDSQHASIWYISEVLKTVLLNVSVNIEWIHQFARCEHRRHYLANSTSCTSAILHTFIQVTGSDAEVGALCVHLTTGIHL